MNTRWPWLVSVVLHAVVILLFFYLKSDPGETVVNEETDIRSLPPSEIVEADLPSQPPLITEVAAQTNVESNRSITPWNYQSARRTPAVTYSNKDEEIGHGIAEREKKPEKSATGIDADGIKAPEMTIKPRSWAVVLRLIKSGQASARITLPGDQGKITLWQGQVLEEADVRKQKLPISKRGWELPLSKSMIDYTAPKAYALKIIRKSLEEVEKFELRLSNLMDENLLKAQQKCARDHGIKLEMTERTEFELKEGTSGDVTFEIIALQTDSGEHLKCIK